MVKSFLALLCGLFLFVPVNSENFEEKVKFNNIIPDQVAAGEEFSVTTEITNISVSGVARLQHYLPPGFLVEEVESKGADFMFEENSVKLIWSKFPADKQFSITYKVRTEKNLTGSLVINGEFVFQNSGKTEKITLKPIQTNVADQVFNAGNAEYKPQILRRLLSVMPEKGEYKVEIVIRTNGLKEPAQFTDEIPADYTVELLEAHGADFKFENHAVLFDWKQLPSNETFSISYMVKSGSAGPSPVINGVFVYGDLTVSQSPPKEIPVVNETALADEQEFNSGKEISSDNENTNANSIPESGISSDPSGNKLKDSPTADAITDPIIQKNPILKAETGITFKVQVAATQNSSVKNSYWFDSNFRLREDVELTYHEGWKKYLIGSFLAYNDATDYRIKTQSKVPGAFVVAYENGMRIPVNKAVKNTSLNQ